jgi:hypothetical protein
MSKPALLAAVLCLASVTSACAGVSRSTALPPPVEFADALETPQVERPARADATAHRARPNRADDDRAALGAVRPRPMPEPIERR